MQITRHNIAEYLISTENELELAVALQEIADVATLLTRTTKLGPEYELHCIVSDFLTELTGWVEDNE